MYKTWSADLARIQTHQLKLDKAVMNWNCMFIYAHLAIKNNSRNLLKIKNNGILIHEMLSLQAVHSGRIIMSFHLLTSEAVPHNK